MKFMYFSIKYRSSDILLIKKQASFITVCFAANHTYYIVNMVSVTSSSRYITAASRYITAALLK